MKPTLLLLHGALGAASLFDPVTDRLAPYHELEIPGFEGHGGSPLPKYFKIEAFSNQIYQLLHRRNIFGAYVFGFSMGGYIGLHLAAQHPERVSKVLTLGTKFDWTPESGAREAARLQPEKLEEKAPAFAAALAARHSPQDWKTLVRRTAGLLLELGQKPVLSPEVLAAIRAPVTLALGAEDHMVSWEETTQTSNLIPGAVALSVPGMPHPLEQIQPADLAALILGQG